MIPGTHVFTTLPHNNPSPNRTIGLGNKSVRSTEAPLYYEENKEDPEYLLNSSAKKLLQTWNKEQKLLHVYLLSSRERTAYRLKKRKFKHS